MNIPPWMQQLREVVHRFDAEAPGGFLTGPKQSLATQDNWSRVESAALNGIHALLEGGNALGFTALGTAPTSVALGIVEQVIGKLSGEERLSRGGMKLMLLGIAAFVPFWGQVVNGAAFASDSIDFVNEVAPRPPAH